MALQSQAQVFIVEKITPVPRPMPSPYSWAPFEIQSTKVNAKIHDFVASTTVEEQIYNPNAAPLEGMFLFPVPKGAQLDKFTMDIDGKPVEAELLNSEKAKRIYEDIVRKMKDPALLEYAGRDLFRVKVFPIPPHGQKRLVFSFTQLLKTDSGLSEYVFPLNTEKFSAAPLKNVSIHVEIEGQQPLKTIYSPSHSVEIKRHASNTATVTFNANDIKQDTDFELLFMSKKEDMDATLMTYGTGDDDGYFLFLASPGIDTKDQKPIAKDVVFVLDTSGSMAGNKLNQAKKALQFCVENLNEEDRFEIIRFSSDVESIFNEMTTASESAKAKAGESIKKLKSIGGTDINAALTRALSLQDKKSTRPFLIIFLTDGQPTVGETDNEKIVASVNNTASGHARVFCFGIGTDVNTHLLDTITEQTRAYAQYVLPEEDIEVKVSTFYSKIKDPLLANLKLTIPNSIGATKLQPTSLPDLFKGDQLVVVGRYSGTGKAKITLEGTANAKTKDFTYHVNFQSKNTDNDFIPRLWATRRVGWLMDQIRLHGESVELKDEVTQLAREYGIITPFTAYLILEDEQHRNVPSTQSTLPDLVNNTRAQSQIHEQYRIYNKQASGRVALQNSMGSRALQSAANANDGLEQMNRIQLEGKSSETPQSLYAGTNVEMEKNQTTQNQKSRYVAGRCFYQNGNQWVDAGVQKIKNQNAIRIQFNSKDYFTFMANNPQALKWLSLGRNLQLIVNNSLYEIYE